DQAADEIEQVLVDVLPVDPAQLGVLAVAVVVAALRAAHFVAGNDHRDALGQEDAAEQVALLAGAELQNPGILGIALCTAVPGAVVVRSVLVVLLVRLVVLLVVGDEVAHREAVVGGDEVDRGVWPAAGRGV